MATEKSKVLNTAMIQTALIALNVNLLTSKEKETFARNAVMGSKKALKLAMTLMRTAMTDAHDIEPNWVCTSNSDGETSVCEKTNCGNFIKEPEEECDYSLT